MDLLDVITPPSLIEALWEYDGTSRDFMLGIDLMYYVEAVLVNLSYLIFFKIPVV